jgi:hypothetical protein
MDSCVNSRISTALAFAATMLLAGFLLFQVQLVLGKFILPWFGGSASTWLVCMLFFQVALLVGYAYAYAITLPLPVRRQAQLQIAIVVLSLALLPIAPSDGWKPVDAGDPTWRILAMLAVSVGLPYIALATTTPLLSRWLAHVEPSLDPVRFFAASNIGSFLGLLSYPFLFERVLSSAQQAHWWSWAYVLYVVLLALCAVLTLARTGSAAATPARPSRDAGSAHSSDPVALWVAYATLGSALLLATTNAITQWSAVVPFLWVVPLSIYLLTFVIVFGYPRVYHPALFGALFLASAGTGLFLPVPESSLWLFLQLVLQSVTLFAGCMICHGEMVRLQPPADRLPKFYLAVAAGGALGGVAIVLLAPVLFRDFYEHPIVLAAIAAIAVRHMLLPASTTHWRWAIPTAAALGGLYFLAGLAGSLREDVLGRSIMERTRNFYGVLKIVRRNADDPKEYSIDLFQAGIDQGGQYQAPERKMQNICGFNDTSGLGIALAYHQKRREGGPQAPLRIGVLGLGAGMVAALGRDGDFMRYYELNPAVAEIGGRHFTFLKDGKAKTDIRLGDARLVLERQLKAGDAQNFDVLVLNAFRGASPPMHLMTKEAFAIYSGHLAENGMLAVNFELDTFEMAPLHRGMAKEFGYTVGWFETNDEEAGCQAPISWAIYTRDKAFFTSRIVRKAVSPWRDDGKSELVWTDQDSNLMSIMNWNRD